MWHRFTRLCPVVLVCRVCVCDAKNIPIFRHAVKCKCWLLFRVMWISFPSVEIVPKALGSIPVVGRTFLSVTMNSMLYLFHCSMNWNGSFFARQTWCSWQDLLSWFTNLCRLNTIAASALSPSIAYQEPARSLLWLLMSWKDLSIHSVGSVIIRDYLYVITRY